MTYLSIILPIYNEEKRLNRCLDQLTTYLWNYTYYRFEILCVLNGCSDSSERIAYRFHNLWPQIKIHNLSQAGKGLAIRHGMLHASGQYRMMMDVDLATPPTEIPRFLDAIHRCAVVVGRRPEVYDSPLRKAAHWGYKKVSAPFTKVRDPQSGFKMFTGHVAKEIFEQVTIPGWGFDVEALFIAHQLGYSVVEIPVRWEHAGGSKLNPIKDGMQMLRELLTIRKLHAA